MRWKAIYDDKTQLLGGDGLAKYTDIQTDKLIRFELIRDGKLWLGVNISDGKRLIYRQRVFKNLQTDVEEVAQLVGWQVNANGKNVQSILFVMPDGVIEHLDGFSEDDTRFCEINFLPQEQVD